MTKRLDKILLHLYKFRFLTRNQLQTLLNHKQFNRVIVWLNQLSDGGYIRRYYDARLVTEPAVYSLGLNGRKYLLKHLENDIEASQLDRVWREPKLSLEFRQHCLLVADCYLSLSKLVKTTGAKLKFHTKVDLYGLKYLILPNPDTYFSIEEANGNKKCYFLDVFDDLPPRMELRKRIRQYFQYYEDNHWQDHNDNSFPSIIFVCPNNRSLNYLNIQIQKQLENEAELTFFLTTREKVKTLGICRKILQKVLLKE